MCGIAGAYLRHAAPPEELHAMAAAMSGCIVHRGPDDSGAHVVPDAGVALAFRRLAIIDVSPAGHQPMLSTTGRFVIIYNGEVYNFAAIRAELESSGVAPAWRGHSDTEVMLAAIEAWGVTAAVKKFIGMFAIALWDGREQQLHLIRDRVGVKPLYYSFCGRAVLFGSELKSLAAHPLFKAEIDRDVVALYARYGYVPAPYTIYRNTFKLVPGSILTIGRGETHPRPERYWDAIEVARRGRSQLFRGTDHDALQALDDLLRDAVGLRMIADVPLGVFLSGGIDSSVVTAMMQQSSSTPVKTFSIGMQSSEYDEANHAEAVARHLGTNHTAVYATPEDALNVIPLLPQMYDEPFADSSQIPTYLVSRLARQSVTVSLSGDGGDELFGGYNRYFLGRRLWRGAQKIPRPLRPLTGALLRSLPSSAWDRLLSPFGSRLPALRERAGERLHKFGRVLAGSDEDALYRGLVAQWDDVVPGAAALPIAIDDPARRADLDDITDRMMLFDQLAYLVDDVLVKVDRASMAVSLEAREPLLDHRLIEFAWTLPLEMKLRDGQGKWLLRRLLSRYVPDALIDRPKMGFAVPLGAWLRGPLREWAEDLLDPVRMRDEGWFDVNQVRTAWLAHVAGGNEWAQHLWTILMFQAWLRSRA